MKIGRVHDSLDHFRKAVRLLPGQATPHYWLGKALIQAGHMDQGRKELAVARALNRGSGIAEIP
jgi:Flp pilus assembly protein TadD